MSRVNEPYDLLAEEFVLGAILHDPSWYYDTPATAAHFYNEAARTVWIAVDTVMREATVSPGRADLVSLVRNRVRASGGDGAIAAAHNCSTDDYLAAMLQRIISRADLDTNWVRVDRAYKQRETIAACRRYTIAASGQEVADLDTIATRFQNDFAEIMQGRKLEFASTADLMVQALDRIAEYRSTGEDSTKNPIGIRCLDEPLGGGLTLGRYTGVAAKRKMGKSRILLASALSMVVNGGVWAVDFYSLEMTQQDIGELATAWYLKRPPDQIRDPRLFPDDEFTLVRHNVKDLKSPARWMFGTGYELADIKRNTIARKAALGDDRPLAVFVDYIQEVNVGEPMKEYDRVTLVSRTLAQMARDLGVSVVVAAQFNREVGGGEPQVHHLKSSGQLENDFNELFIFHREAVEEKNATAEAKKIGALRLALNRHGDTMSQTIVCDMATLQFQTKYESDDAEGGQHAF